MDLRRLSHIDEELVSSEVAALCFLCCDVLNRKRLATVRSGRDLFLRLEERGLLDNNVFLSQLLRTIRRADLLYILEADSRCPEESAGPQVDSSPILSDYRVMLYEIYEDLTEMNVDKLKFLLKEDLGRRQTENCRTALDMFAEMEKACLLSNTNLERLRILLEECDRPLALKVQSYIDGACPSWNPPGSAPPGSAPNFTLDQQRDFNTRPSLKTSLSVIETQPNLEEGQSLYPDASSNPELAPPHDPDYYSLTHNPRGVCMIISNETFVGPELRNRPGTKEDEMILREVFSSLGFKVEIRRDLTAAAMRKEVAELSRQNFLQHDALVVCVLSHGEVGCVFGIDGKEVLLRELTKLFTSEKAHTLAGKPKLFFIQACQGKQSQKGAFPCPPNPAGGEGDRQSGLEEDAGPIQGETVPFDADFLLGMATVQEYKSFRNTSTGSIYIQELCRQLEKSAGSSAPDDILTVLTRVNREVSRGVYLNCKQMPEPKYTLTKKLVLKHV
ncbi:caspase-8 [Genypterus blacodes]|uniref:caspase-8 n=1 Tax=Genypterus blacodes TaxID=154954 RepID=UPI003F76369F